MPKELIQAGIGVAIIVLIGFLGHDLFIYLTHQSSNNVEVTLRNITEHDNFSVIEGGVTNHGSTPVRAATIVLSYFDSDEKPVDSDQINIKTIAPGDTTYFIHEHVDPKGLIRFWKAHLENVKF